MKAAQWIASMLLGMFIVCSSFLAVIAACVVFFKLTGRITDQQPLYFDLQTPGWPGLLVFLLVSASMAGAGYFVRQKLRAL